MPVPWRVVDERSKDMAVHAVLLPGGTRGEVLYFGGYRVDDTHRFDVQDETIFDIPAAQSPEYNIFCGGQAFLADGRVLVGGGQLHLYDENGDEIDPPPKDMPGDVAHAIHGGMTWGGERRCSIYAPVAGTWDEVAPLNLDPDGNAESGGRWYPTLVTLANGEVLAVGGHPDLREDYPSHDDHRHSNNVPERYTPGGNGQWALLGSQPPMTSEKTSDDGAWDYDFQRTHLLPNGRVFFASPVRGRNRTYDPYGGGFFEDEDDLIDLPGEDKYREISAEWTSVMLPLLHQENYRPRVLLIGGETAERIDLGSSGPAWQATTGRDWSGAPPVRDFGCPVILPTGEIFLSGGTETGDTDAERQAGCVREGEIYSPGIDWATGAHDPADDEWRTVEAAEVGRHYHSVALLLPNGTVWTAGSNGPSEEAPGGRELRIEIYRPDYADEPGRPTIAASGPCIGYAQPFAVGTPQASSVRRVALMRCGSCTHGFNPDQRLVSVPFVVLDDNTLQVFSPPDGNIAPPGYYMIWVVDDEGRPCEWAPFIRVANMKVFVTADVSTYSVHEVEALGPPAHFNDALFVVFDSFLPGEVDTPTVSVRSLDDDPVPGMSVTLGSPLYEGGSNLEDISQRIVFPVHVHFDSTDAFDLIPDDEDFQDVLFSARYGDFSAHTRLALSKNPNPRMSDGNPHWLSVDLRVFKTTPGEVLTADVEHGDGANAPFEYIQGVLAAYNAWEANGSHPFGELPTNQEANRLALYSQDADGNPIYNYAIARVRFRAPDGVDAADVRVFFRYWMSGASLLSYSNPHGAFGSYRRHGDGADAAPLLGLSGGEIVNVPCFAEPRAADMEEQTDSTNRRTLEGAGAAEVYGYFGCWLDNNQDVARFPLEPEGNGPFAGDLLSIQELVRGLHQCLVAEIHYTLDPIASGATPSSSDNLAQRNILFDESDNPGGFASHLVHHTLEIKASPNGFPPPHLAGRPGGTAARLHPDELVIHWGNLPRESLVTLFAPQIDVDEVLRFASRRGGPGNLSKAGPGTISIKVTDGGFVPLPGPLAKNIASLLSIQLPPDVTAGQTFTLVVRQVDGRQRRVVGTTQFDIRVRTAAEVRPRLERNLSVLRHIQVAIPAPNRWYPVFQRYVGELADRVRAMGGDPDSIAATPTGSGTAGRPTGTPDGHLRFTGVVDELVYDCFGRFEGFVLEECDGRHRFHAKERAIEEVVHRACKDRCRLTVVVSTDRPGRPYKIILHC